MTFVAKSLGKKFGHRVVVTIRDAQALDDIAIALRAVLKRSFPDLVLDVFVSFVDAGRAAVWVETAAAPDSSLATEVERAARSTLEKFAIKCDAFDFVNPLLPEPSTAAILRSVKVLAPAPIQMIFDDLLRRGFSCPSPAWLSFKLDSARKRGLVLRDQTGRFALTSGGLDVVPWNRSASSSDIERILAVARRKEW